VRSKGEAVRMSADLIRWTGGAPGAGKPINSWRWYGGEVETGRTLDDIDPD